MEVTARGRRMARGLSGHLHGRRGSEWGNLYYKFVEMHKETNVRSPGGSIRADVHWNESEAKRRCDECLRINRKALNGKR